MNGISGTDPFERDYAPGYSERNAPHSPDSLAQAFEESKFGPQLTQDMSAYRQDIESEKQAFDDFEMAHQQGKQRHALKSSVYAAPSVIRLNSTALAEHGLLDYIDVVGFSYKPLGPAQEFTYISMDTWRLDENVPTHRDGLFTSWLEKKGFLHPVTIFPSKHWAGWGERVNWIEIEARTKDHKPWDFCIDNIVLRFYKNDLESRAKD